jgi:hypothetical protein
MEHNAFRESIANIPLVASALVSLGADGSYLINRERLRCI